MAIQSLAELVDVLRKDKDAARLKANENDISSAKWYQNGLADGLQAALNYTQDLLARQTIDEQERHMVDKRVPPYIIACYDAGLSNVVFWTGQEWAHAKASQPNQLEKAWHYSAEEDAARALRRMREKYSHEYLVMARIYASSQVQEVDKINVEFMKFIQANW